MRNPEENAGVEPEVTATTPLSEAKLIELIEGYLGVLMANYATKDEVETALAAFWAYHNRQAENSAEVARCINDAMRAMAVEEKQFVKKHVKSFAAFLESEEGRAACNDNLRAWLTRHAGSIENLLDLIRSTKEFFPEKSMPIERRRAMEKIWAKYLAWAGVL